MQAKEIVFNGKRLFYRVIGQGPAVVLLHGFGEDGTIWKNQFSALPGYKLIIPDLPGSGHSEMIEDMSMEGLAEVIRHLILYEQRNTFSDETQEKVVLMGHSMGGYITLAFAEKYSNMLNGFGLFHSTVFGDSEEKKQTRQKGIDFIQQHGAFPFLKNTTPNLYNPVTKEHQPTLIEEHINSLHNFSDAALVSYYVSMMQRRDRTHILKQSNLPVLFIMGKYDMAVPLDDGLKQCHLPIRSDVHILEDSGHMGMREEPEKSNLILNAYLTSTKLPY